MRYPADLVHVLPMFRRRVFGFLSKYPTLDREEVIDACTTAFVEKWNKYYNPARGNPEQFAHLISLQAFANYLRDNGRLFPCENVLPIHQPSHHNRLAARDLITQLIPHLTHRQLDVLSLMGLDLETTEIARQLNLTRMQVRYAMERIREHATRIQKTQPLGPEG